MNPLLLIDTFYPCINITIAPEIPDSVVSMKSAFRYCETLVTPPPVIPASVENLFHAFRGCKKLTGTIEINGDPIDCSAFEDTELPIVITGSCSEETKRELAESANNGNVTY